MFNNEQGVTEAMAHDSPTEKESPTDPGLLREMDLQRLTSKDRSEMGSNTRAVASVAEATGFTVMLESFSRPAIRGAWMRRSCASGQRTGPCGGHMP